MSRTLGQILKTNYPINLQRAVAWVCWTLGSVVVSLIISCGVDYAKFHYLNVSGAITHGELFALSSSLIIGAGRLLLKDEDLEDFIGRQYFGLLGVLLVLISETLFFVWKIDDRNVAHPYLGKASIYAAAVSVAFVFFVVLIDASRIPRAPGITNIPAREVNKLINDI